MLNVDVEGSVQEVVRYLQWHAYKAWVQHIDFQRIVRGQKIHMKVPLHFHQRRDLPGRKLEGGMVSHAAEVDRRVPADRICLSSSRSHLWRLSPAAISIHLSELRCPQV